MLGIQVNYTPPKYRLFKRMLEWEHPYDALMKGHLRKGLIACGKVPPPELEVLEEVPLGGEKNIPGETRRWKKRVIRAHLVTIVATGLQVEHQAAYRHDLQVIVNPALCVLQTCLEIPHLTLAFPFSTFLIVLLYLCRVL